MADRWQRLPDPPNACGSAAASDWPHHIVVGVGRTAVSIGLDDRALLDRLEPWRIDEPAEVTDYALACHPPGGAPGAPRPLPYLRNGSCDIAHHRDAGVLTDTLLRILASFARPAAEGQVRLALMPVVRNGVALLAPIQQVGPLPARTLEARGLVPYLTRSTVVDLTSLTVEIDAPLGSGLAPVVVPLTGWWFATINPDREFTPAGAVALAMGLTQDKSAERAHATLRDLADLVDRLPPRLAPLRPDDLLETLDATLP